MCLTSHTVAHEEGGALILWTWAGAMSRTNIYGWGWGWGGRSTEHRTAATPFSVSGPFLETRDVGQTKEVTHASTGNGSQTRVSVAVGA